MARGTRGSGAKNKGGTPYRNPKPKPNVRGSGTGKTQYNKNKSKKTRQQERARDKGKMSNIPPVVASTGQTHKDYEIEQRQKQGGYIPPGMTTSDGKKVKPQQGGGGAKGRKYETNDNNDGKLDQKWGKALSGAGEAVSSMADKGLDYKPSATSVRSGASKGAITTDPWRSFTTESGSVNDNN